MGWTSYMPELRAYTGVRDDPGSSVLWVSPTGTYGMGALHAAATLRGHIASGDLQGPSGGRVRVAGDQQCHRVVNADRAWVRTRA